MIRRLIRSFALIALAMTVPLARGQAPGTLPTAAQVLDQYIEATGGKAMYEKFTNRVSEGTLEVVGANVKGKITLTQASPNKITSVTDLGPLGTTRQGTDGQVAWEISTISGERLLTGEEKEAFVSQALFNGEVRWRERYMKAECVAIENVDGKPAAKLVLTRKVGKPLVEYYDLASHLIVRQIITAKGPMGEITIDQYPGDYRKIDGVLMPTSVKQKVFGQEMVMNFSKIKHNVTIPPETFAIPQEIAAIQAKKK